MKKIILISLLFLSFFGFSQEQRNVPPCIYTEIQQVTATIVETGQVFNYVPYQYVNFTLSAPQTSITVNYSVTFENPVTSDLMICNQNNNCIYYQNTQTLNFSRNYTLNASGSVTVNESFSIFRIDPEEGNVFCTTKFFSFGISNTALPCGITYTGTVNFGIDPNTYILPATEPFTSQVCNDSNTNQWNNFTTTINFSNVPSNIFISYGTILVDAATSQSITIYDDENVPTMLDDNQNMNNYNYVVNFYYKQPSGEPDYNNLYCSFPVNFSVNCLGCVNASIKRLDGTPTQGTPVIPNELYILTDENGTHFVPDGTMIEYSYSIPNPEGGQNLQVDGTVVYQSSGISIPGLTQNADLVLLGFRFLGCDAITTGFSEVTCTENKIIFIDGQPTPLSSANCQEFLGTILVGTAYNQNTENLGLIDVIFTLDDGSVITYDDVAAISPVTSNYNIVFPPNQSNGLLQISWTSANGAICTSQASFCNNVTSCSCANASYTPPTIIHNNSSQNLTFGSNLTINVNTPYVLHSNFNCASTTCTSDYVTLVKWENNQATQLIYNEVSMDELGNLNLNFLECGTYNLVIQSKCGTEICNLDTTNLFFTFLTVTNCTPTCPILQLSFDNNGGCVLPGNNTLNIAGLYNYVGNITVRIENLNENYVSETIHPNNFLIPITIPTNITECTITVLWENCSSSINVQICDNIPCCEAITYSSFKIIKPNNELNKRNIALKFLANHPSRLVKVKAKRQHYSESGLPIIYLDYQYSKVSKLIEYIGGNGLLLNENINWGANEIELNTPHIINSGNEIEVYIEQSFLTPNSSVLATYIVTFYYEDGTICNSTISANYDATTPFILENDWINEFN
jgi:hypothetical protein